MMRDSRRFLVALAVCWTLPSPLWSVGFNIQGRLTDSNGVNRDGTFSMAISLYSASTGETGLLWKKTYSTVSVRNGSFQIFLEDPQDLGSPLETAMAHPDQVWAQIQVAGESAMVPRIKVGATPFALAVQGAATSGNRFRATGNTGIGTTIPSEKLTVEGGYLKFNTAGTGIKWADGTISATANRPANVATLQLVTGNQATSLNTYIPVIGSAITLSNVTAGSRAQYSCNIVAADQTSEVYVDIQALIDGSPLEAGETTLTIFIRNNSNPGIPIPREVYQNSFVITTPPLSAGSHTFSLNFKKREGASPRLMINSTYPLRCTAMELL